MKYWRTIICALALGASGLAAWGESALRDKKSAPAAATQVKDSAHAQAPSPSR